jgi:hypothetical protein
MSSPIQNFSNYILTPTSGFVLFINADDGQLYVKDQTGAVYLFSSVFTGGGSVLWGQIDGDIYLQPDLQIEFATKVSISGAQTISGAKTFADTTIFESGATAYQGLSVFGTSTFSGGATFSGSGGIGINTIADSASLLHINGGANVNRVIMDAQNNVARIFSFRTNNSQRWAFRVDGNETGVGNAGADWQLRRYADNGSFIDSPFSVNRSTGVANIRQFPTIGSGGSYYPSLVVYQYTGAQYLISNSALEFPSGLRFFVPTSDLRDGSMIQVVGHSSSAGAGTGTRTLFATVNGTASANGVSLNIASYISGASYVLLLYYHYYNGQLYLAQNGAFGGYASARTAGTFGAISPSGGGFTFYLGATSGATDSQLLLYSMKGILHY